uniref:Uncharacterized protein n=1 Tax=Geobacter sp. (strain M21) TaxID=443144 RepID=C6E6Q6_GEOSM
MSSDKGKRPTGMVAPKSTAQEQRLQPVEELAAERGVPAHALAGMRRYYGWADGKQVSAEEFESKMAAYRVRPMGSGRG